ncbi:hypothetical protein [Streptomyces sp. NPDC096013]|uniref:hypothetical protein n=1 Tax=Streptomyces sp. NPDC096013 TaxID=3366069 RepID=UPI00381A7BD5
MSTARRRLPTDPSTSRTPPEDGPPSLLLPAERAHRSQAVGDVKACGHSDRATPTA